MRNPVISLTLWTLALGAAAAVACSAPDPGVGYLGLSRGGGYGQDAGSTGTGSGSGATVGNGNGGGSGSGGGTSSGSGSGGVVSTGGNDGGASGTDASVSGGDGGGDGGVVGAAAFLGETTAWASSLPAQTAWQYHANAGQAQQTPTTPCLSCHTTGGAGSPFLSAGFVATAAGGTTGAADVEVRVYATGGTPAGYSKHTDANGYYWIDPPVGGTTGPYQAGVRDGTTTQLMPSSQATSDCQSCHAGATGVIHLP
jgi:hypothetical protein